MASVNITSALNKIGLTRFGGIFLWLILHRQFVDTLKKDFDVGLKLKGEFKQEYENLENPETKRLVKNIEENVMEEFKGTGLASVTVLKLRQGSIIADLKLTFNDSVGESSVNALLTQAANRGKIGDMEVEEISVGKTFSEPTTTSVPPEDCGTFFEGEDCKKAKPGLIVLCVIGGVAVLAIIVAIIAYGLHKKKSNVASFSNGLQPSVVMRDRPDLNSDKVVADLIEDGNWFQE
nr:uncharacterized protein LOC131789637 [Pocillopora verrucosa]